MSQMLLGMSIASLSHQVETISNEPFKCLEIVWSTVKKCYGLHFIDIEWKGNNILLFGSEGEGIKKHTEKYADFLVRIDMNEKVESLNISNSAAIVFHHIKRYQK